MIAFLTTLVGAKFARPVLYLAIALLALSILGVVKCTSDRNEAQHVTQTNRSGVAISDAAENAVATVIANGESTSSAKALAAKAAVEIDEASNAAQARDAALRAVCQLPEYAQDKDCVK